MAQREPARLLGFGHRELALMPTPTPLGPIYYRERQHRKGRLVRFVENSPNSYFVTVVSICGRDGEESKVHRKRTTSRHQLTELYQQVEVAAACTCVYLKQSTFAPVDRDDEGDCFHFHRVFVCGGCGKVAPWCQGGDRDPDMDPEGDLCCACAVANLDKAQAQGA